MVGMIFFDKNIGILPEHDNLVKQYLIFYYLLNIRSFQTVHYRD